MSTPSSSRPRRDLVGVVVRHPDGDDPRCTFVGEDEVGEDVGRMTATRRDEVGQRPTNPLLVVAVDDLDDADAPDAGVGEHRLVDGVPLATCDLAPLRIGQQRALGVDVGRLDDAVPAVGHPHEHHAAVPVDAEVNRAR